MTPDGPRLVPLPGPRLSGPRSLEEALLLRRSGRDFAPASLELADVAQILWSAQGVTDPEGYRTAASSGATYPLELYLVAGDVDGLLSGTYRYDPEEHELAHIQPGDQRRVLTATVPGQEWIATAPAVLVFAAVHARTAAKYPDRAGLYVDIEVGHASQNVYLQATSLDLTTVIVGAFDTTALHETLDLPGDQVALALMPFGRPG